MRHRKPPSASRPGRRERRRAETRERIFRAALHLFAERGFLATTVEDITEAADVGKGTFFNYFPSKEHVLSAFGEMQVSRLVATVGDPRRGRVPLPRVVRRVVHALAEEPGRSPALVRALMAANLSSTPVRLLMLRNLERGRALLAQFFAARQQQGELRRGVDPQELARAMQQVFFGTLVMWALDPSDGLNERLDGAFALFWSGIRADRASQGARR